MLRKALLTLLLASTTVALAPAGAAHPSAVPFTSPSGQRCYYYDDHDTNTREFWREANGVLNGGVPEPQEWFGLPPSDGVPGSGLQLTTTFDAQGNEVPPDVRLEVHEIQPLCLV